MNTYQQQCLLGYLGYYTGWMDGWLGDTLYRSTIAANVYTPEQYPAGWEVTA